MEAPSTPPSGSMSTALAPREGKGRLLVLAARCDLAQRLLQPLKAELGLSAARAGNPVELQAALRRGSWDLALLFPDEEAGEGRGMLELLRLCRHQAPELPVAAVLSEGQAGLAGALLDQGVGLVAAARPEAVSLLVRGALRTPSPERTAPPAPAAREAPAASAAPQASDRAPGGGLAPEAVRAALEEGRLRLLFQPIVALHAEPVPIHEVLLRMRGPDGRELLPRDFLPAAARGGLMPEVDRWVLTRACDLLAEHRAKGEALQFLVKLDGQSLEPGLSVWVGQRLRERELEPHGLILELREADAARDLPTAIGLLQRLGELGCGTALSHFGTEPSSLERLEALQPDYVKLAPSLVARLSEDPRQEATVRVMVQSAHQAGVKVIATFVQEASTLTTLWQCGVDYIQGYFLQRPEEALTVSPAEEAAG